MWNHQNQYQAHLFVSISGAYVPLTMEGNVVVDGVLASCYASFDHDLAHLAMSPIRWFPEVVEWMFGRNDASPVFVDILKSLGRWVLPSSLHLEQPSQESILFWRERDNCWQDLCGIKWQCNQTAFACLFPALTSQKYKAPRHTSGHHHSFVIVSMGKNASPCLPTP